MNNCLIPNARERTRLETNSTEPTPQRHVVLFPFMSKGHTIPFLHLSRLLLNHHLAVTIITTPANRPFIAHHLDHTSAAILELPFPQNRPEIPAGVESTDNLPSMSLFFSFLNSTSLIQPHFEQALETLLPPVSFLISDAFLWWTLESASKFKIPRLVSFGISSYNLTLTRIVIDSQLLQNLKSKHELVTVPPFPWLKLTKNDFDPPISDPEQNSLRFESVMRSLETSARSFGMLVNSFKEIEPAFLDYWNREFLPKAWCVGPLCLAEKVKVHTEHQNKRLLIQWLDPKDYVLYVAFGSQAEFSSDQIGEIAKGLEESMVNFVWVIRKLDSKLLDDGFEERVKNGGIVVRDWVDQSEILRHESVKGFLSHCGWNSVLESVCAGVPILAWPLMADQHLNTRMVTEEMKVGLRVETCDGSVRGFVKWDGLKKMVKELMEGEMGEEVRKKVKEFAEMAKKAMEEGSGSSWRTLKELLDEIEACKRGDRSARKTEV